MTRLILILLLISKMSFGQIIRSDVTLTDTSVNLYAFVGEKISVTEFDPNVEYSKPLRVEIDSTTGDTVIHRRAFVMDNGFDARYKVLQQVFNNLSCDTVTFRAFDHYGRPGFELDDVVLLYISKSDDGTYYFHQKYQFDRLRKGKSNTWVGEKGESLQKLFEKKKRTVFKARGFF